jgi:aldose 1-epimerase
MKLLHAILFCMTSAALAQTPNHTTVTHTTFGHLPSGSTAELFTLRSPHITVRLTTYGARIVAIDTPDRTGKMGGIVLGYDKVEDYLPVTPYFGVVAGRYANRIAKGQFTLDGRSYQLSINNGPNSLHGGKDGFDRRNWSAREVPSGVEFTLISPDGDQGFPGTLTAHVTYTLDGDTLSIQYQATTDKPTVINLTNHAYFNLSGDGNPSILDERLQINADKFTPVDATLIPTGELAPVAGTPFDFTTPHLIGERINADNEQLHRAKGYDHNWVLRSGSEAIGAHSIPVGHAPMLPIAAIVTDPTTGRILTVRTTEPGIQFYSGNFLDGRFPSRSGGKYTLRSGFCLETQHFPDSPNHPNFPSTELKPGQTYQSTTTFTFTNEK